MVLQTRLILYKIRRTSISHSRNAETPHLMFLHFSFPYISIPVVNTHISPIHSNFQISVISQSLSLLQYKSEQTKQAQWILDHYIEIIHSSDNVSQICKVIIKELKVAAAYLRNQNNFGNQKNSNVRRRLSEVISIASKKHDGYQSLSRTGLQVHYGIFTDRFFQCFKLIATHKKKKKKSKNSTT